MPPAVNPSPSATSALVALHAAVLLFGFAGLFGPWLGWPPLWIVLGRTAIAAAALGALRLADPETRGAGLAARGPDARRQRRAAGAALGRLLRRDPGREGRDRPARLRVVSAVHAAVRARAARRAASTPADGWTAALVTAGLVLLTPSLRLSDPAVQGVAWGLLSGATFALLAVRNRRSRATRSATDIACGQNLWAAFMLAPVALAMAPLPEVDGRSVVLILALGLVCTALAHTLFIAQPRPRQRAHRERRRRARARLRHRAGACCCRTSGPACAMLAGGALIVGAALVATRRAAR